MRGWSHWNVLVVDNYKPGGSTHPTTQHRLLPASSRTPILSDTRVITLAPRAIHLLVHTAPASTVPIEVSTSVSAAQHDVQNVSSLLTSPTFREVVNLSGFHRLSHHPSLTESHIRLPLRHIAVTTISLSPADRTVLRLPRHHYRPSNNDCLTLKPRCYIITWPVTSFILTPSHSFRFGNLAAQCYSQHTPPWSFQSNIP